MRKNLLRGREPLRLSRFLALSLSSAGAGVAVLIAALAVGTAVMAVAANGQLTSGAVIVSSNGATGGKAVRFEGLAAQPTPTPTPAPSTASTDRFGYAVHTLEQSDPATYIALAENGGATTVRDDDAFQMASAETKKGVYDWTSSDQLMQYEVQAHLHVLILTDTVASWSGLADPADFGAFVGQLAARYGPGGAFWTANPSLPKLYPSGIEIWNEENLSPSTPPATYAALLKAAYAAVRTVYPAPAGIISMPVILGGLGPAGAYNDVECTGAKNTPSSADVYNPLNYLADVYAAGAGGSFDAVGWHPYNFVYGGTAAQMLQYNVCSAWSQMDQTTPSVVSLMQAGNDASKKIWATEAGVPTCLTGGGSTYGCVSEAEQAALATTELTDWKSYPWAGNYYWYDLRDDDGGASTSDDEEHFGTVRGTANTVANGGPESLKPAYTALKTAYTTP